MSLPFIGDYFNTAPSIPDPYQPSWRTGNLLSQMFIAVTLVQHVSQLQADNLRSAESSIQAKTMFLATMSHELRTPLLGIIGWTEVIIQNVGIDPSVLAMVHAIHECSKTLTHTISDILDFSKIELGQLSLENIAFSIPALISDVIAMFPSSSHEVKLTTKKGELDATEMVSDPYRLRQILTNLISNAIKFSCSDKQEDNCKQKMVVITYSSKIVGCQVQLYIDVQDFGIGMTQQQIENVFQPFQQADTSTTRRYGGTGLGLSISRQLTALMGGSISCVSEPGKGSTFSFSITGSLPPPERYLIQRPKSPMNVQLPLPILLAEDNVMNQKVIQAFSNILKIDLVIANNGEEALNYAEKEDFFLILMDLQMPVMNGVDATRAIRCFDKKTPIIAVTASSESKKDLLLLGFDDTLPKPFALDAFKKCIARWADKDKNTNHEICRKRDEKNEVLKVPGD